jgi:TolA-binding protein
MSEPSVSLTMFMRIWFLSLLLAAVGLLVGCSTPALHAPASLPDSDSSAALRKELQQTQTQLDQLTARAGQLEQQVRALEQSNEELQQEMRKLQREPRWSPPANQVPPNPMSPEPHLTPLQRQ